MEKLELELLESRLINLKEIVTNEGQIVGVPENPRFIRDAKFLNLKASIEDDISHLYTNEVKVYELEDGSFCAVSGNMRIRACKEIKGIKKIPCKIIPHTWTAEQIRKEAVISNVSSGEWDYELLANQWEQKELNPWGVDVWEKSDEIDMDEFFKDHEAQEKEETFKIILEYTEEEYNSVTEALKAHEGTKENIIFKLLGL
jgi:hypothetical protein